MMPPYRRRWRLEGWGDEQEWLTIWVDSECAGDINTPPGFTFMTGDVMSGNGFAVNEDGILAVVTPVLTEIGYSPVGSISYNVGLGGASGMAIDAPVTDPDREPSLRTTITTSNGRTLIGCTVDSIIHRVYGPDCFLTISPNWTGLEFGTICSIGEDGLDVELGTILHVDGWSEIDGELQQVRC